MRFFGRGGQWALRGRHCSPRELRCSGRHRTAVGLWWFCHRKLKRLFQYFGVILVQYFGVAWVELTRERVVRSQSGRRVSTGYLETIGTC
jgi:hypothetical protein